MEIESRQSRGLGSFLFAAIPWALGVGAIAWLSFYAGVHGVLREQAQEQRRAVYVGAETRPKAKVKIEIVPSDCSRITRADVDGKVAILYAKNECHEHIDYMEWHWQTVSPDGVIIGQGYDNRCSVPSLPGDTAECVFGNEGSWDKGIGSDDRAESVRFWTHKSTH